MKRRTDDKDNDGPLATGANMVFILLMEFMATEDDEASDIEEGMAQLTLDAVPSTFEKREEK